MIHRDHRLTLNHVQSCAPNPFLSQRLHQRVRINQGPSARVDKHARPLHLLQKLFVYQVSRLQAARREDEEGITLPRQLIQVHAAQGIKSILFRELLVSGRSCKGGRIR